MSTIHLTPSYRGTPAGLSGEHWRSAIEQVASRWSYPTVPCTSLQLIVDEPRDLRVAADDEVNLIVFRNSAWCHNEDCTGNGHFPHGIYGMTQTYPLGSRGASVRGADIELNAVHYTYASGVPAASTSELPTMPLEAALLHEIGHAIGLEDACSRGAASCGPSDKASAMYAPAKLTSLTTMDVQNVCSLYPRNALPVEQRQSSPATLENGWLALWLAIGGLLIHCLNRFAGYRRRNL